MAEANISVTQDQFSCAICLDLLKDPVTIPCGHSYCMSCITDCWNNQQDHSAVYRCPLCKLTFTPRPLLQKNVVFAEMVEKLKNTKLQTAQTLTGPGDVECDICTGEKHKAVKSCLVCLESYCQTHFERHEEFHSSKRHKVTDVTGQLQEMICPKHDKPLEIYCCTDQQCICYLCTMDQHRNHDTVAAVVERTEKQRSAQAAVENSERTFAELIHFIERSRSEVIQIIRDREMTEVSRTEGLLKQLELEIEDLKRRDAELEQLLHTDNHIHFLQRFQSFSEPAKYTDNSVTISSVHYEDVGKSVSKLKVQLEELCKEEIEKIFCQAKGINIMYLNEPMTRNDFLQYFFKLSLDQNTAHKHLVLMEENRVATFTDTVQPYPDHPDRIDNFTGVLCRESVRGRCYWEVEWRSNKSPNGVGIAVSYKTVRRMGDRTASGFGHNDHSWKLGCSKSCFSFLHNSKQTKSPILPSSCRIGVYVDYRAGILSFYNVSDKMTLIQTVQTTFTQPLYPGFWIDPGTALKLCHI